jgi:hypothetical protein
MGGGPIQDNRARRARNERLRRAAKSEAQRDARVILARLLDGETLYRRFPNRPYRWKETGERIRAQAVAWLVRWGKIRRVGCIVLPNARRDEPVV